MLDTGISVEIRNEHPVELIDLTGSLFSFADEYKRHVTRTGEPLMAEGVKLYVEEIRKGSIIADLIALAPYALPFAENSAHIVEFIKHLKTCYEFLLGKKPEKPKLERINYENLINIVEPIAKDNGSQIIIGTLNLTAPISVTINSMEANAIQNGARRELHALKEPTTGIHEKVLLYWYQARNDPKSQTGDKAIIESIYSGPVKVIFVNDSIKAKLLTSSENPFTMAYIVDVAVETIQSKPTVYRILEMHENFDRDPGN